MKQSNSPLHTVGRHCCLWCHICTADLVLAPSARGPVIPRTAATLESDLARFKNDGSNINPLGPLIKNYVMYFYLN